MGAVDESDNHVPNAGFNLDRNFRKARHDLVASRGAFAIHENLIRASANRLPEDNFAVDHDDQRAFVFDCGSVQTQRKIENVDPILTVSWEIVLEPHAAASAR